jgi:diguanylate cyclase (GGDEF)-like protein
MGNRRHVEMQLAARQNDLQRHGWPFGVIFLDIDHFKLVNDTSGHDVGDEVLRMVARTLRSNLRPSDTVGRWGGEEFLVVLSNVEAQGLIAAANKLSVLVEKSRLTARDREISVTVSAGATLARPGERIDTLLKRVDGLLYRSKSAGRNRITTDVRSRRQVLARETQAV